MIFTFGHSNLTQDDAVDKLYEHGIDLVVDVRSHPTSRMERWRREELTSWLPDGAGISYEWYPGLGGWTAEHVRRAAAGEIFAPGVDVAAYAGKFPKQRISKPTEGITEGWTNQGLYDYQWFMALPEFARDMHLLLVEASRINVAIMCAELLWWKCHRSMIADFLHFVGAEAFHMQPKLDSHTRHGVRRLPRYDPRVLRQWLEWKNLGVLKRAG